MKYKLNLVIIIIALTCTALGRLTSSVFSYIGVFFFAVFMVNNDEYENYKVCLLLIPMIRIFDVTGISSLVNMLLVFPIFLCIIKNRRINPKALLYTIALMIIELLHALLLDNFGNIIANLSAIAPLYFCETLLENEKGEIEPVSMARWFAVGITFSAFIYLLGHRSYFNNIIGAVINGMRFEAYADDPNYYSLYIVLSIAGLLDGKQHIKSDYLFLPLLVVFGLLTASKMCTIMMLVTFLVYNTKYLIFSSSYKRTYIRRIFAIAIVSVIIFDDTIKRLFRNIQNRFVGQNTALSMENITTGRSILAVEYLKALITDPVAIFLGYGFQYRWYFDITLKNRGYTSIAHNTYLDVVLSWGVIGVIAVMWIISDIIKTINRQKGSKNTFISWYPFIALLTMFMALSCLNAGMFWFMMSYPLLIVKYYGKEVGKK